MGYRARDTLGRLYDWRYSKIVKITKIQQQKRIQDRYSIYVDEVYAFSVNEYQLIELRLHVGDEVTPDELNNFAIESQFGKAYERSLNYVMIRPRSEQEIKQYLKRTYLYPKQKSYVDKNGQRHFIKQTVDKPQTLAMIERVMKRLDDRGYINDVAFAQAWVSSRQLHKKTSRRKLAQELYSKGIDQEIVATILQNCEDSEQDNLQSLVHKKRKLVRYQDDTKLTQYLLRQGFNYDDIRTALDT